MEPAIERARDRDRERERERLLVGLSSLFGVLQVAKAYPNKQVFFFTLVTGLEP